MNKQNECVDDVIASHLSIIVFYIIYKILKTAFLGCCCSNMQEHVPISKYIGVNIILPLFKVDGYKANFTLS